jgi:inorganic triphosphatase YgiF
MSEGRERELKYLYAATLPPQLPEGWSLGTEAAPLALEDTYLDADGALAARGWGLRRRESEVGERRYTLKRDATATGALHSREEIEAVVVVETGAPEGAALPEQIRSLIDREFGPDVAARLQPTIALAQQRSSWRLARQGVSVADMTIDQIAVDGASWCELEIEFLSSLSDDEVQRLSRELHGALQTNPQISISTESKGERARRLSL